MEIVAYWQKKSEEWLGTQQFVTCMGRDCTQTMAIRLNQWEIYNMTNFKTSSTVAKVMKHHFMTV